MGKAYPADYVTALVERMPRLSWGFQRTPACTTSDVLGAISSQQSRSSAIGFLFTSVEDTAPPAIELHRNDYTCHIRQLPADVASFAWNGEAGQAFKPTVFEEAGNNAQQAAFDQGVQDAAQGAGTAAKDVAGSVANGAQAAAPVVGKAAQGAGSALANGAEAAAPVVGDVASGAASGIASAAETAAPAVGNALSSAAGGASQAATDSGACFPARATVDKYDCGAVPIDTIRVGDMVLGQGGTITRVVAMLHWSRAAYIENLIVQHARGQLAISPSHMVRARCRCLFPDQGAHGNSSGTSGMLGWSWIPASALKPGDELEGREGAPLAVMTWPSRAMLEGAYAPLTDTGDVLVDGVACSCFAPPTHGPLAAHLFTHDMCNVAMFPLRALDLLRTLVERSSQQRRGDPRFTLDVFWLTPHSPKLSLDETLHPWASLLLWALHELEGSGAADFLGCCLEKVKRSTTS